MNNPFPADEVKIVAEIGINWNSPDRPHGGEFAMALHLIEEAAAAGADYIKFQLYDPEKIFPPKFEEGGIRLLDHDFNEILREEAKGFQLTEADWTYLARHIREYGAQPMASVFDEERLGWVERTDVPVHKIASRTVQDHDLCAKILRTGRPTLVSMGQWSGVTPPFVGLSNAFHLECVSSYPPNPREVGNLDFEYNESIIGFSDHFPGMKAATMAVARGARVVEKHYTHDVMAKGSDHRGSMDKTMLTELRRFADYVSRWRKLTSTSDASA